MNPFQDTHVPTVNCILLISDEENLSEQLETMVRAHRYSVHCRSITARVIMDILDNAYACIFMDFRSQRPRHWNFIRVIRKVHPVLLIVVLTDRYDLELKTRLSEMGVFYYGILPFQEPEVAALLEAIERVGKERFPVGPIRRFPEKPLG